MEDSLSISGPVLFITQFISFVITWNAVVLSCVYYLSYHCKSVLSYRHSLQQKLCAEKGKDFIR